MVIKYHFIPCWCIPHPKSHRRILNSPSRLLAYNFFSICATLCTISHDLSSNIEAADHKDEMPAPGLCILFCFED